MRIVALLIGVFAVAGCQSQKEPAKTEPADAPVEVVEAAPEDGTKPDTVEPAEAADPPVEVNPLVGEIMGITRARTVEDVDGVIQMTLPLEVSPQVDAESPPKVVTDAMMFAIFYTLPTVYGQSAGLDEFRQVYTFGQKTVGEVKTTRASFTSLNFDEKMRGVTGEKAKRAAQKKMLRQLPKGAVKFDKKYKP
ncbi:MAG: hypothetical protein ACN4G0_07920 [Polyangiales bacterium]